MADDNNKEIARMVGAGELIVPGAELDVDRMPPILAGQSTKAMERRVERFYYSIGEIFEMWVKRRKSPHTQRAYRQDVMALIDYMGFDWPKDSTDMLTVSVSDMIEWRDYLEAEGKAPNTLNRRISSVSSFYKYLQAVAAEMRLPIVVPNPAHAQFLGRSSRDPIDETLSITAAHARTLMDLPKGEDDVAYRDRAILRLFLYLGPRLNTACQLRVQDCIFEDMENPTIRLLEKGAKRRTEGLNPAAAQSIDDYMTKTGIESGPLFRPQTGPNSKSLAKAHLTTSGMYRLLLKYLEQIPGAMKTGEDGIKRCKYSPHSLRATTATLLLGKDGMDVTKVQKLLGHRHVTTTQIYDKRRRTSKDSASHDVPI